MNTAALAHKVRLLLLYAESTVYLTYTSKYTNIHDVLTIVSAFHLSFYSTPWSKPHAWRLQEVF